MENPAPVPDPVLGIDDYDDADDNIAEMFLTFTVGDSRFAICLTHVIEIVVGQSILSVPDVPAYVTGVINLRGRVIPVMDVRTRFGLARQAYHDRTGIIVIETAGTSTGLAVDEVKDVVQIPESTVSPAVQVGGTSGGAVRGVGQHDNGVTFILDVDHLLNEASSVVQTATSLGRADDQEATGPRGKSPHSTERSDQGALDERQ